MEENSSPSQYTLTLKKSEEGRLEQIFYSHCGEEEEMSLQSFIIFSIEKDIASNTTPFSALLALFSQAAGDKGTLSKSRFFFAISLLARQLYPESLSPVESLLTKFLADVSSELQTVRLPSVDDTSELLMSESAIKEFGPCESGLLQLLLLFSDQNILNRRKVVGLQAVQNQNIGISARNLLRYCRIAEIVPHLVNVETFQESISAVFPPLNREQADFFDEYILIREYETDVDYKKLIPYHRIFGEPYVRLTELCLVLGRIAVEGMRGIEDPIEKLHVLLIEKLRLGPGMDFGVLNSISYDIDYLSDASFSSIEDHDEIVNNYSKKQMISLKGFKDDKDLMDVVKEYPYIPSLEEITRILDTESQPAVPPVPVVIPINPPPYVMPMNEFPLPKPPTPKGEKRPAPVRQQNRGKKEESAASRLKFAPMPGFVPKIDEKNKHDKFLDLRDTLTQNMYQETAKTMLSNPAVQPCLIREVLLTPDCPDSVSALAESGFVYQNNGNFSMAISSLEEARTQWAKIDNVHELRAEVELFFGMAKGSVFESCGKDELALGEYYRIKAYSDKLPMNSPDRALVYCGLGSVLIHGGHPHLALRCFLGAKKHREKTTGGDSIDTATAYNNCGVCMFALSRHQEATAYFQLAEAIFDMHLGSNHPRTMTARQNIQKERRESFITQPEFQPLWKKQFVDPYPKGGKKKKKKGKKKKKR